MLSLIVLIAGTIVFFKILCADDLKGGVSFVVIYVSTAVVFMLLYLVAFQYNAVPVAWFKSLNGYGQALLIFIVCSVTSLYIILRIRKSKREENEAAEYINKRLQSKDTPEWERKFYNHYRGGKYDKK